MPQNKFYVSAYATSLSQQTWNPIGESQYYQQLVKSPEIVGIEQPLYLDSKRYPLDWLRETIPDHVSLIITTLPVFMQLSQSDPLLGLASMHEKHRYAAMKVMENINQQIHELNQMFSRNVVKAIHFHALPKNKDELRGNKTAFAKSLQEMKSLDWMGAELNLEHCDAQLPTHAADKGFLLLDDELEALDQVGGFGITLNWARSVIEYRSVDGPIKHIQMAKQADLLRGFFFSGCTDDSNSEYGAWKDTHTPVQNFIESAYLPTKSLLGANEIQQVLSLLNDEIYLGVKVSDLSKEKNIKRSVGLNIDSIRAIQRSSVSF